MVGEEGITVSIRLSIDPGRGARIESLIAHGHEWLWRRPSAARRLVSPGMTFVDVGGIEECFPTVAGVPDHGTVWSRPWEQIGERTLRCESESGTLERTHAVVGADLRLDYTLRATPGQRFVWAMHMLLAGEQDLRLGVPAGVPTMIWPKGYDAAPDSRSWPPSVADTPFDDLSTDDGTATFALLPSQTSIVIQADDQYMRLTLEVADQPAGIAIWRNLRGYAWDDSPPYRSIGVEPMLGRNPDLRFAGPGDAATVPAAGSLSWTVIMHFPSRGQPDSGRQQS